MKKAKIISCFMLGTFPLLSVQVFANQNGGSYSSNGVISYFPNSDDKPKVDPNIPNPSNPVQPLNPDGTEPAQGTGGALSIDFASSFDFGANQISNLDQIYFAKAQIYKNTTNKTPNYVQVSDYRGTNKGWVLRVKENGQFTSTKETKHSVLTGATVNFMNAKAASNSSDTEIPIAEGSIQLVPEAEVVVMTAKQGTGSGTWVARFGEQANLQTKNVQINEQGDTQVLTFSPDISLYLPGATVKDAVSYRTTFAWTLSSLPEN